MNRRIFVIQVFSGLVYQTVQTFLVAGIRRREDGKKTITNDGGSYGFVVGGGQSGAGFVSGMGSVTKVCAETEDTTEQNI